MVGFASVSLSLFLSSKKESIQCEQRLRKSRARDDYIPFAVVESIHRRCCTISAVRDAVDRAMLKIEQRICRPSQVPELGSTSAVLARSPTQNFHFTSPLSLFSQHRAHQARPSLLCSCRPVRASSLQALTSAKERHSTSCISCF